MLVVHLWLINCCLPRLAIQLLPLKIVLLLVLLVQLVLNSATTRMLAHPAGWECATNARLHNCTKTTLAASNAKNAGPSTSNTGANRKTAINTR